MQAIDNVPLWVFFSVAIGLAIFSIECGFRLGKRRQLSGTSKPVPALGTLVAAMLGLLTFLFAFTFNIAVSKFDERRSVVIDEANAIGTTYLRADFLDQPIKVRVKKLLREYVVVRLNDISSEAAAQAISKSESIQQQLWSNATTIAQAHPNSPVCALFISSLNELIDLHAKRVMLVFHIRVPLTVWLCLLIVAALSMLGLGYYCGLTSERNWTETFILVGTFGVVLLLVTDLDRPQQGFLRTSEQPLIDLSKKFGPP